MKILYIHGFGSCFDPTGPKVKELSALGEVVGVSVDYERGADEVVRLASDAIMDLDIDLIVGTSMGGWTAAVSGCKFGLPFVAINPVCDPVCALHGFGVEREVAETFFAFPLHDDCAGLILLDKGDELLNSLETEENLKRSYAVTSFNGGSHQFDHMKEACPVIEQFYTVGILGYGLSTD